jgi:hypothetical protein
VGGRGDKRKWSKVIGIPVQESKGQVAATGPVGGYQAFAKGKDVRSVRSQSAYSVSSVLHILPCPGSSLLGP